MSRTGEFQGPGARQFGSTQASKLGAGIFESFRCMCVRLRRAEEKYAAPASRPREDKGRFLRVCSGFAGWVALGCLGSAPSHGAERTPLDTAADYILIIVDNRYCYE